MHHFTQAHLHVIQDGNAASTLMSPWRLPDRPRIGSLAGQKEAQPRRIWCSRQQAAAPLEVPASAGSVSAKDTLRRQVEHTAGVRRVPARAGVGAQGEPRRALVSSIEHLASEAAALDRGPRGLLQTRGTARNACAGGWHQGVGERAKTDAPGAGPSAVK